MTTIIMKEHESGVTIGFDSQATAGYHGFGLESTKVFVNNGMIFGVAGAVLDNNIIRYADLPCPDDSGWDIDRWVTNRLIPAVSEALHERHAQSYVNGKVDTENNYLVVVKGRVYKVESNTGWIRRVDGTYAIGSGSDYAIGALSSGAIVRAALDVAKTHDIGTGGRLTVVLADELLDDKAAA